MRAESRPKILHIITGLGLGGAEAMLTKLVGASRRYRHHVLSLADRGALGAEIEAAGGEVHALGLNQKARLLSAISRLRGHVRALQPDLIQGWLNHGNLVSTLAKRFSGPATPLVWNVRQSLVDWDCEKWLTRRIIALDARLSRRTDAILYNSTTGAIQHEEIGFDPTKRVIIPNGFDLDRFFPAPDLREATRKQLGLSDGDVAVGLVARVHKMKNHAGFFEAAARILRTHPNVRFILVGTDASDDNPEFTSLIPAEISNRTTLLGSRRDIPELTRALDIACNVSIHGEGFPNTVGEAMASAVPCVVTDVGDSASIVGDTGVVARDFSAESISEAVINLIDAGPERRAELGRAARARVAEHFSLPVIVERYETFYADLLSTMRPARPDL